MHVHLGQYKDEGERDIQVVIHHYDTWNMDHTLALIIEPMLRQLAKTKHGAPNVDWEDVPRELRPSEEELRAYNYDGTTDPKFFQRWDWVMNEMIFAFASHNSDWEDEFFDDEGETAHTEIEFKGIGPAQLRLFPDDDGSMEDYELYEMGSSTIKGRFDKEAYTKYSERMSNGFRLFGKYYQSLWD
jgi:hypothetical protein